MSYQVLARKWRPKSFKELVGQEHVVKALSNALNHQRLHHAYLFSGTRGVGKTTLARIFARAINCEAGISDEPCGVCNSCQDILNGRSVDLIEVDAASRTKVEDTRELLDNVQFAPTQSRFKVYLIDEVHMLSGHSFNALLKTLEEPPAHVKFILATTDPQKLPVTILSRCLQFHLKSLLPEQITPHLKGVMSSESMPAEDEALTLVAEAADGSMRDALSLLDQAIGHSGGDLTADSVRAMLGLVDKSSVFALLRAITAQDAHMLASECQALESLAPNYTSLLSEMMRVLLDVAKAQLNSAHNQANAEIRQLAEQLSKEDVQLLYQIALTIHRDLAYAPHPGRWFEMGMIRMMAFMPDNGEGFIPSIPAAQGAASSSNTRPSQTTSKVPPAKNTARPAQANSSQPVNDKPVEQPSASVKLESQQSQATPASNSQQKVTAPPEPVSIQAGSLNAETWSEVVDKLNLVGVSRAILQHSALRSFEAGHLQLELSPQHGPMLNARIQEQVTIALKDALGEPKLKVSFEMASDVTNTPNDIAVAKAQARQDAAVQELEKSPQVQKVMQQFEGRIDASTASLAPEKTS